MSRQRLVTWDDPTPFWHRAEGKSGLELLQRAVDGEFPPPPMAMLMDIRLIEVARGHAVFRGTPQEFHYNPLGTVHGGVLATLLDTATGCAVHSTLPRGFGYTSIDLSTKFLKPVTVASGMLRCVGTVISKGRRTALAEARLTDAAGRLVATAQSSCLIFEVPPNQ